MTYYPEVIYYFYVSGLNPKKLVNMKNILVFIFSLFLLESAEAQLIDPIKWSYSHEQKGAEVLLKFKATIDKGWHLYSIDRITLHGFPAANTLSGISRVTTLPAPMIDRLPMVTPGQITAEPPTHTSSPITMGLANSSPDARSA